MYFVLNVYVYHHDGYQVAESDYDHNVQETNILDSNSFVHLDVLDQVEAEHFFLFLPSQLYILENLDVEEVDTYGNVFVDHHNFPYSVGLVVDFEYSRPAY